MSQFKALLVGAGGMGRGWAQNLRSVPDDVELAGWVDIRPGAAAEAAEALKIPLGYAGDDLSEALAVTKPDFVVDVTIPEAHHDVTIQALAAGAHVLGEKPMASSMEQARAMVAASEKAGKLYMVSQSRRYNRGVQSYRRLIERQLGSLGILNSDFYIGAHFGGFRDEMPSPLILDMAIHTFDAARYLSGRDPIAVYCDEFNPSWSWYKGDASATAIFEMAGGLRYTYRGSWCGEGIETSWEGDWRAVGANGTAIWNGSSDVPPKADIVERSEGFQSAMRSVNGESVDMSEGIAGSLQDFLNALRTGTTPMGECHDNIKSLAMVFAAIESAESKQRVVIEK